MGIVDFIENEFELDSGEPIKLHDYQREFLDCDAQFRLILKSRQVGMSTVISWEALANSLLKDHRTILFVSASQRQATELLNYVKRILGNMRLRRSIPTLQETQQSIMFSGTNSRIISLPNSPNTIQGLRAHEIYIDEFGIMDNDKRILDAILPSISLGGRVTILSTPWGKRGEFYRLVTEARDHKNEFVLFEIPYTRCNYPGFQDNINKLKSILDPMSFAESYMCEFVDENRSYFPYELMLPCIDDSISLPRPGMELVFGIDFGRRRNSTVITITEEYGDFYRIRHIKEFLGIGYTAQLGYISKMIEELNPREVRVDSYGVGVRLYEELREKHGSVIKPVQFDNRNKNLMIADLRILFEDKKIRIPKNDKLVTQLHALERKISGGFIKWEPGSSDMYGKHDDYVWSLAMSVSKKTTPHINYFVMGGGENTDDYEKENDE